MASPRHTRRPPGLPTGYFGMVASIDHGTAYQVKFTKSGKEQKLCYERVAKSIK